MRLHKLTMIKSRLSFEKGSNLVINNVFGINTHDEISMSIVFHKLHTDFILVVKLKLVEKILDVRHIRQTVHTAVAEEKRKVVWDRRYVVSRRQRLTVMFRVALTTSVVVFS